MQTLAQKVLEYLEYGSTDGKPERQKLRQQLKEMAQTECTAIIDARRECAKRGRTSEERFWYDLDGNMYFEDAQLGSVLWRKAK